MVKVMNLTARGVPFLGWRVLPNGSDLTDPNGQKQTSMPADVAYSAQAKRLADQGLIAIDGYIKVTPVEVPAAKPKEELKPAVKSAVVESSALDVLTSAVYVSEEKKDEEGPEPKRESSKKKKTRKSHE